MPTGPDRASTTAWDQAVEELCAAARWGAADLATVDATLGRLSRGDPEAWLIEWTAAAGALWAQPDRTSPGTTYLAASSYYAAALALLDSTDGTVDETLLWRRQRDCWDNAIGHLGGEKIAIQFERVQLDGYFFSAGPGRRPVIVIDHGGRVATSYAWFQGGAAAHARGYHWLTFDGPGRQSARCRLNLLLRPDWEVVIAAVLDAVVSRADVDSARVALLGVDHAGFGISRALVSERRCVAAAVLPGITDASRPLLAELPATARGALFEQDRESFETELRLAALFYPAITARLRRITRDHGTPAEPLYDVYSRILEFCLDADAHTIATPLAVATQTPDGAWARQAEELCELVPAAQPIGYVTAGDDRAIDWIAEHF